ncbi:MAG: transglutaminase-like domain-containing protein, partial [Myxococcota bacterium]
MVLTSCGASPRVELRPWPPEVGVVPTETFGEDATADIAVLLDEGHVRFLDPKRPHEGYTLDWIFRFRVLTPAGRYAASRRTALTPGDRLLSLSARSYAPGQPRSLRELRPEDVRIVAAASGSILLYRGAATVAFEVPGVEVGDVVEVRGRLRRNHLYRLPTWSFDGISPVKKSRFVVHVPPGWELTWASRRGRNRVDFAPRRTPEQGATMWVFEAESLPPLRPEPGAPSLGALTVQLAVRQAPGRDGLDRFGTWDAIAEFYRRLVDRQSGLTEQDWQAVVRELGSRPSPEALYAYVRDRVRYVALFDDDLGGFQPHPAHDVLTKRYGDCKDQSTLLVSLLNRVGVAAYPMLVGTRDRVFFDAEFPSVSAFNHVVVAVPRPDGKYIFLDPTDIEGEYGLLSHYLQ